MAILYDPIAIVELIFFLTMGVIAILKLRRIPASTTKHQVKNNNNNPCNINNIPNAQKGKCQGIVSFFIGIRQKSCKSSNKDTNGYDRKDKSPIHSRDIISQRKQPDANKTKIFTHCKLIVENRQ